MNIARLCWGSAFFFVLMTAGGDSSGQDVPPPKPVPVDPGVPAQKAPVWSIRSTVNGVTLVYQEFLAPTQNVPFDTEMEFDGGRQSQEDGEQQFESKVLMGDKALDQIVFGPGLSAEAVVRHCHQTLRQKIESCGRIVELTENQKRKLQLAGSGDIARLIQKVGLHKAKFEKLADGLDSVEAFGVWLTQLRVESNALRLQWRSAPFETGSLFSTTLATMLTPEQFADVNRRQKGPNQGNLRGRLPAGQIFPGPMPVNARLAVAELRIPQAKDLDAILTEWEQATAKIRRLDCTFTRFSYDPNFEIERRATGSLAIDARGRAVYGLAPAQINPGEKSRKKTKDGIPYTLTPVAAERWHWTGKSVFRVDETEGTFNEIVFPIVSPAAVKTTREFHPDPPELPEEDAPPLPNQPVAEFAAPVVEKPAPDAAKARTIGERIEDVVIGIAAVAILSQIDWVKFADGLKDFWLARPFLLGMSAEALRKQFKISLVHQTDTEIRLRFIPRRRADAALFERATLILSKDRYVPKAIQMIDATGSETVHVFKNVQINLVREGEVAPDGVENLERPDLRGYRPVP